NLPKPAPKANIGPKAPAGMGVVKDKLMKMNFKMQYIMRLKATAGCPQNLASFPSPKSTGLKNSLITFLSPNLIYIKGYVITAITNETEKHHFHLCDINGYFSLTFKNTILAST